MKENLLKLKVPERWIYAVLNSVCMEADGLRMEAG